MNIVGVLNKTKFLFNENSSTILTSVGALGTLSTAYLTGRATFKAAEVIAEKEKELVVINEQAWPRDSDPPELKGVSPLSRKEKLKLVWPLYIPPVVVCGTTIVAIITANRINAKKIAALTVASGISERALQEYKSKVVETLGEQKERKIREAVSQDQVDKNPGNSSEVVIVGDGDVLCYDTLTGRYFNSSAEKIKRAENEINSRMIQHNDASLSEFYDLLGLKETDYSATVGWNATSMLTVYLDATLSADGRPCLAIGYHPHPTSTYSRFCE